MREAEAATEAGLRFELVRFGRLIHDFGYSPGTSGNLSVRLDEHRLLVTPTGMSKFLLEKEDMVIVDHSGRLLAGTREVTSEISMHLAVYERRRDVRAVIHAHPPVATAFACSGRALDDMLCQEAVMALGVVPLARYATTGTDEVAESLAPFIAGHDAILMANHGAVSYGTSLLSAFQRMETLEHLAQVSLAAHQLGSMMPLTLTQIDDLHAARNRYERNVSFSGQAETESEIEETLLGVSSAI
jgi:L-fuculose-phosphate aldolase